MSDGNDYRPGDHWVIDDRTGFKVRHSRTVKEWTGLRVKDDFADTRHPQDFVRGRADKQDVPFARPVPTPVFIGPGDVTADDF